MKYCPGRLQRVWRYQRGNQNRYIEEEQTTQWSKDKVQKDKQRSTKHTYKTKDPVTRTPLKTGGELRCSGRVSSSSSTSDTCRVNLVTNPVISQERTGKCLQNSFISLSWWHFFFTEQSMKSWPPYIFTWKLFTHMDIISWENYMKCLLHNISQGIILLYTLSRSKSLTKFHTPQKTNYVHTFNRKGCWCTFQFQFLVPKWHHHQYFYLKRHQINQSFH